MTKANIPNILTISRIFLILISMILATSDVQEAGPALSDMHSSLRYTAFALAIIAGITDLFDGYLARKWNHVSDFGALLDPVADKIFITCTSLILVQFDLMPCWILALIISREFSVTGIRMAALRKGVLISADRWGKLKTSLQMALMAMGGLIWVKNWEIREMFLPGTRVSMYLVWWILLLIILGVTILSGWGYFKQFTRIIKESTEK